MRPRAYVTSCCCLSVVPDTGLKLRLFVFMYHWLCRKSLYSCRKPRFPPIFDKGACVSSATSRVSFSNTHHPYLVSLYSYGIARVAIQVRVAVFLQVRKLLLGQLMCLHLMDFFLAKIIAPVPSSGSDVCSIAGLEELRLNCHVCSRLLDQLTLRSVAKILDD